MNNKVIHITSVHIRYDNRVFKKMVLGLSRVGWDVRFLVADGKGNDFVEDVNIIDFGKRNNKSRWKRIFVFVPKQLFWVIRNKADIYHIHDPELLSVALVLRLLGRKVIFDMHEDIIASIEAKTWLNKYLKSFSLFLFSIANKVLLSGMPLIFAEDSYASRYKTRSLSRVIRNYPNISSPNEKDLNHNDKKEQKKGMRDSFHMVYMGSITRYRGSEMMLRILSSKDTSLVKKPFLDLIGSVDHSHQNELDTIIKKNNLDDSVKFHGFLQVEKGYNIVQNSDLAFAILSPLDNYLESLPTKILEYVLLGVPVVCSGFPYYRQIFGEIDTIYFVDPENEAEILETVGHIMNDYPSQKILDKAREMVQEQYSWSTEMSRLDGFYKELLSEKKS